MHSDSPRGGVLHINTNEMCMELGCLYTYSVVIQTPISPYYFIFKTGKYPMRITGDLHGDADITTEMFTNPTITALGSLSNVIGNGLIKTENDFNVYHGSTVSADGEKVLAIAGYGATPSAHSSSQSRFGKFEISSNTEVLLKLTTTAASVNLIVEAEQIKIGA